jgi:hypothetical protein
MEIRRIIVPGQLREKKVCESLSQQKRLDVVIRTYHPSYSRKLK